MLEGSVRKAGNRLRINAQLINTDDGYHLWSERYDRKMDDVFEVQDEIARAIVDTLKVKLLGEVHAQLVKPRTSNLDAYNLYLKGRSHLYKLSREGFRKGLEYFEEAKSTEPNYAQPYAGTAVLYRNYERDHYPRLAEMIVLQFGHATT